MPFSPSQAVLGDVSLHYKGTVLLGKRPMDWGSMKLMRCELRCSLRALITKRLGRWGFWLDRRRQVQAEGPRLCSPPAWLWPGQ